MFVVLGLILLYVSSPENEPEPCRMTMVRIARQSYAGGAMSTSSSVQTPNYLRYPAGNGFLFELGTGSQGGRNAASQRRFNLGPQKCNLTHDRIRLLFALR
jgi:hypothetical protein